MSRLGTALRRTGIICALVCWFSSAVAADPIVLWTTRGLEGRALIEIDLREYFDGVSAGTSDPGPFSVVRTATARGEGAVASLDVAQNTTISPTGWFGSGSVGTMASLPDIPFGTATAEAQSIMEIGFRLAEPMYYRFAGTVSADGDGGGSALISLNGPDVSWVVDSDGLSVPIVTRSGLLLPGDYAFNALALGFSFAGGSGRTAAFNLQFDLSDQAPVPEPATLLLFGTGAAFVGRRAWRRRREQSATGSSDPVEGTQGAT